MNSILPPPKVRVVTHIVFLCFCILVSVWVYEFVGIDAQPHEIGAFVLFIAVAVLLSIFTWLFFFVRSGSKNGRGARK